MEVHVASDVSRSRHVASFSTRGFSSPLPPDDVYYCSKLRGLDDRICLPMESKYSLMAGWPGRVGRMSRIP